MANCPECKTIFRKRGVQRFCSKACRKIWCEEVRAIENKNWPGRDDELKSHLDNGMPRRLIAVAMQLSVNAINGRMTRLRLKERGGAPISNGDASPAWLIRARQRLAEFDPLLRGASAADGSKIDADL